MLYMYHVNVIVYANKDDDDYIIKETLHSRHHSTVLPRLGACKKENLKNLHTHAIDSAIQLLGNNILLKERTP